MATDEETESAQLALIEGHLGEIVAHVDTWINDRFLAAESAVPLNLEDVAGLILWLEQWKIQFDSFADTAARLDGAGRPALAVRLGEIQQQIDVSIASFTDMAAGLMKPSED
ncbi:MAG TPA: hypothetical protein VHT30_11450 [Acidimicrobiales bacterium]|jgi:hypothetical protein|nr:hypothetical protein [Acidimicrobiales bacterium]